MLPSPAKRKRSPSPPARVSTPAASSTLIPAPPSTPPVSDPASYVRCGGAVGPPLDTPSSDSASSTGQPITTPTASSRALPLLFASRTPPTYNLKPADVIPQHHATESKETVSSLLGAPGVVSDGHGVTSEPVRPAKQRKTGADWTSLGRDGTADKEDEKGGWLRKKKKKPKMEEKEPPTTKDGSGHAPSSPRTRGSPKPGSSPKPVNTTNPSRSPPKLSPIDTKTTTPSLPDHPTPYPRSPHSPSVSQPTDPIAPRLSTTPSPPGSPPPTPHLQPRDPVPPAILFLRAQKRKQQIKAYAQREREERRLRRQQRAVDAAAVTRKQQQHGGIKEGNKTRASEGVERRVRFVGV
ncbi:MAG: hypothetical protein M1817_004280 [Caeruleum heppii]|nr:MAG: hypothetical protein M1817_004280 [Caeruleum heppii]